MRLMDDTSRQAAASPDEYTLIIEDAAVRYQHAGHPPVVVGRGHDYSKPFTAMQRFLDGMEAAPYDPPRPGEMTVPAGVFTGSCVNTRFVPVPPTLVKAKLAAVATPATEAVTV